MNTLRPVLATPLRPAVSPAVHSSGSVQAILFAVGFDSSLTLVDYILSEGTIVAADGWSDAVLVEVNEARIAAETAETVTLDFGS